MTARSAACAGSPRRRSAPGRGRTTTTVAPDVWSGPRSPKCSSVVVMTSSPARRSRPASTMLHPSVVDAVSATCSGETPTSAATLGPKLLARLEEPHEPRVAAASLARAPHVFLAVHRVDRPACERPDAPGLQVGIAVEHRELGACLLEGHVRDSDDSGSKVPVQCASSSPTRPPTRLRTTGRWPRHSPAPARRSSS